MEPVRDLSQHYPTAAPITPVGNAHTCLVWGWWLIGGACVLSLLPFVGMLAWFIGPPIILAAFVLSIIAISQGLTGAGVVLLLFSITVAPVMTVFAPIISAFLFAGLSAPA